MNIRKQTKHPMAFYSSEEIANFHRLEDVWFCLINVKFDFHQSGHEEV